MAKQFLLLKSLKLDKIQNRLEVQKLTNKHIKAYQNFQNTISIKTAPNTN